MTNNKQSSIEWFLDQITYDNGYGQRRCSFIDTEDLTSYFEQAKAMHKEEILQTFQKAYVCGYRDNGDGGIDYYNETFGEK